ncbi:MAG TPA: enoyl-CoA hydratase-related protein, partial [Nitrososphaerales archaeon]|nr:enoyl-CoA hydratase-related protein [Nitrososphaerales archaeon]
MGDDLLEALKEAEKPTDVRCLVLTGEGRAFSAGEDLNTNRENYEAGKPMLLGEVLKSKYNPIVQRIRRMEKPVLASVNGLTAGAGLGLALACDLRAASDKATFHEAFIKVGLVPDSGTSFWLTRILGLAKAMEVGMLGEPIDASKALNLGLVNWVFPHDRLREETTKISERLAKGPTKAIGLTKRALNRAVVVDMDSALEYETYLQDIAGRTRDHVEGVKSFFEKREANFSGQ